MWPFKKKIDIAQIDNKTKAEEISRLIKTSPPMLKSYVESLIQINMDLKKEIKGELGQLEKDKSELLEIVGAVEKWIQGLYGQSQVEDLIARYYRKRGL